MENVKRIKWVRNSLHHANFVLLRWEVHCSRKHIQGTVYMLIMWDSFSIKLC